MFPKRDVGLQECAFKVRARECSTLLQLGDMEKLGDSDNAALKKADAPAQMHLDAHGGHAFGLRRTNFPITRWPQLAETWLRTIAIAAGLEGNGAP